MGKGPANAPFTKKEERTYLLRTCPIEEHLSLPDISEIELEAVAEYLIPIIYLTISLSLLVINKNVGLKEWKGVVYPF